VLRLDPRAPCTPRLPYRGINLPARSAVSAAVHLALVVVLLLIKTQAAPVVETFPSRPTAGLEVHHLVFLAPRLPPSGGGGGGGGNQQAEPIRRAEGVGQDAVTVRVRKPLPTAPATTAAPVTVADPPIPSVILDAKPLAAGFFDQAGLPASGQLSGTSTGPGVGGGVGTGVGTGIGPGRGPGLGPGSGGGTGGGIYRAGGAVSAPRLLTQVTPRYTGEALRNKIQGTVVLEAVITTDGCASQIRVVRSLDRGGLDDQAVAALQQWRFEPGRLAGGEAVNVLVTILMDFTIR
jgi:TonB family protein